MSANFDQFRSRKNTGSIKWETVSQDDQFQERQAQAFPVPGEPIPMGLADMDFLTPQPVINALKARVDHGIFGYTKLTNAYFESIVNWIRRRHGWAIERDWIVTTTGVMPSINLLIQTFTQSGEGVIIQPPVFGPFADAIVNNGRTLLRNSLRFENGRYEMDFNDLAMKAADPQVKMLILCSPHNPVGRVWKRHELHRLGEICQRYGVLIVSDEIHSELVYSWATFTSLGIVDKQFQNNLILCTSASKTFNLPGLRTSVTIIPNDALRQQFLITLRNLNELFSVNTLGTLALQTAFDEGEEWLGQLLAYLEANYVALKDYLVKHLPQLKLVEPEALYLLWIDCRALDLDSAALRRLFYDEARVWVELGEAFGTEGEGFIRINIACPRAILMTALERIREAISVLNAAPAPTPR
ncbi:MAG: pyridoxal phosphate-dependent aminotransferase [Chloroflexi bacterium]|nr:pyridoxal phosphate-dependent aminotransferase [Chloroflexota bacterium]